MQHDNPPTPEADAEPDSREETLAVVIGRNSGKSGQEWEDVSSEGYLECAENKLGDKICIVSRQGHAQYQHHPDIHLKPGPSKEGLVLDSETIHDLSEYTMEKYGSYRQVYGLKTWRQP